MSPLPGATWESSLQHIKFWRSEVKRSLGESISNVELIKRSDGSMAVVGLATAPGNSAKVQMVMQAELPDRIEDFDQDETKPRPLLELQPLFSNKMETEFSSDESPRKISPELALHYERMRGQMVEGVDGFKLHGQSGTVLFTTTKEINIFKNGQIKNIAQWRPSPAVLNVSFCESDPEFVAFTSNGQLFVDRDNSPVFRSDDSLPNVSNGVAPFAIQEEFERYDGYFWSPTRPEIVYERADETPVCKLSFNLPATQVNDEEGTMRYPLAGTSNAIVTLRCCRPDPLNEKQFTDSALSADLSSVVPWMEYIVNYGWTPDGNEVFALVMDRAQSKMAVLLIPRTLFGLESGGTIRTIYEEESSSWITASKHLHFLPPSSGQQNADQYEFIIDSEMHDFCHLYLRKTNSTDCIAITSSDEWPIFWGSSSVVDAQRSLVYFLANRISPTLLSLCVSDFSRPEVGCRVLTPSDMSYRFERAFPSLQLNPDIGFVCWVSSVQILPECRLYRFIHSSASVDPLPQAVFTHRIGVQVLSPSLGLQSANWGLPFLFRAPSEIMKPIFFEYTSSNSGKTHQALLLLPANRNGTAKFPVVHSVYAGPSVQLVRNSWYGICQHLKYITFGYAVLMVDGRGSANRGHQFASTIKNRMGSVEIEDQHEGVRMAAERFGHLLDMDRVAVIGWSYGGYASLLLLARFPETYRCACAGGAVSDWHLYDTAYTERYMGMPAENAEVYEKSALSSFVARLPNEDGRLMIVHGMIDENVHFSHCAKLVSALIAAQKPHQLLLFPTERHGIRNGEAIEFFQTNVLSFFARAFSSVAAALAEQN